jgi:hypothetical protein
MKINPTLAPNYFDSTNEFSQIKGLFLTELMNVYAGKKHLIKFLSVLAVHENFSASKQHLLRLQDQLQVQMDKCEKIYELCEQEPMKRQIPEKFLTSVERFIMVKKNENAGKSLLSLIVYIKIHESKESILFNKIKNLAQILGFRNCLFILNQPAQLIINCDDLIERAGILYSSKIAV